MSARILNGKPVATALTERLAAQVAGLGYRPGLAVVLVGDDPASEIYVRSKNKAAAAAGLNTQTIRLPSAISQGELLGVIKRLNADLTTDGILVQLPLPPHHAPAAVLEAIDPAKDVDGFHPTNVGRLNDGLPTLAPCTPSGVMRLLQESGVELKGARALVLGRSAIVGKPMAALLVAANATVTIAHSATRDLPAECRRAEVLVAAIGKAGFVRGDWIARGAIVIDVGINRLPSGKLAGDVAYEEALSVAGAITPVPGGVGPMTIACLLENTVLAAIRRRSAAPP